MTEMAVGLDAKVVNEFLDSTPKKAAQAILRALKRGTSSARTHAGRVVAKNMGMKVGDAKAAIREIQPNGSTLTGELRASLKRIPLIKLGAKGPEPSRGRGRGVSYKAGGQKKTIPDAFVATMRTGHRGIYRRRGNVGRLPITELYGASIGRVFANHDEEIAARGFDQFSTELERQIARLLAA